VIHRVPSALLIFLGILGPAGWLAAEGPPGAVVDRKTADRYEEINIVGEDLKNGVFDPSLEYDEHDTYGGIVMPQFDPANLPRPWRIYNTRVRIVEPKR
jgi:hypothetical protein